MLNNNYLMFGNSIIEKYQGMVGRMNPLSLYFLRTQQSTDVHQHITQNQVQVNNQKIDYQFSLNWYTNHCKKIFQIEQLERTAEEAVKLLLQKEVTSREDVNHLVIKQLEPVIFSAMKGVSSNLLRGRLHKSIRDSQAAQILYQTLTDLKGLSEGTYAAQDTGILIENFRLVAEETIRSISTIKQSKEKYEQQIMKRAIPLTMRMTQANLSFSGQQKEREPVIQRTVITIQKAGEDYREKYNTHFVDRFLKAQEGNQRIEVDRQKLPGGIIYHQKPKMERKFYSADMLKIPGNILYQQGDEASRKEMLDVSVIHTGEKTKTENLKALVRQIKKQLHTEEVHGDSGKIHTGEMPAIDANYNVQAVQIEIEAGDGRRVVRRHVPDFTDKADNKKEREEIQSYLYELSRQAGGFQAAELTMKWLQLIEPESMQAASMQNASMQIANMQIANMQTASVQREGIRAADRMQMQEADIQSAGMLAPGGIMQQAETLSGVRGILHSAEMVPGVGVILQPATIQTEYVDAVNKYAADIQAASMQVAGANTQAADRSPASTNAQAATMQAADMQQAHMQTAHLLLGIENARRFTQQQEAHMQPSPIQGAQVYSDSASTMISAMDLRYKKEQGISKESQDSQDQNENQTFQDDIEFITQTQTKKSVITKEIEGSVMKSGKMENTGKAQVEQMIGEHVEKRMDESVTRISKELYRKLENQLRTERTRRGI